VKFKLQDIADECGIRLNTRVDQLRLSKCVRMCGFEKQHTHSGKWWIRDFWWRVTHVLKKKGIT